MRFQVGFATDIGRKRAQNQDNVAALPEMNLYMVADGMGGHRGGETASALAIEITRDRVAKAQAQPGWEPQAAISEAIKAANRVIFQRASQQPELQGMGTTMTSLLLKDDQLTIGHVGDSRCYLLRPHAIWQLTRDHSVVQEKLRAGLITREEMKTDRMKNVITRSVGFEPDVNVEIYRMTISPGDTFLICSDGLSGLIEDPEILGAVQRHLFEETELQKAIAKLIETANANGGDDNITCVIIQALADASEPEQPTPTPTPSDESDDEEATDPDLKPPAESADVPEDLSKNG